MTARIAYKPWLRWSRIEGKTYSLTVDPVKLSNLEPYRIKSPIFNLTTPSDNVFGGGPTGTTEVAAVDYYIILKPPSPGAHQVRFTSRLIDIPSLGSCFFAEDATHNITSKS